MLFLLFAFSLFYTNFLLDNELRKLLSTIWYIFPTTPSFISKYLSLQTYIFPPLLTNMHTLMKGNKPAQRRSQTTHSFQYSTHPKTPYQHKPFLFADSKYGQEEEQQHLQLSNFVGDDDGEDSTEDDSLLATPASMPYDSSKLGNLSFLFFCYPNLISLCLARCWFYSIYLFFFLFIIILPCFIFPLLLMTPLIPHLSSYSHPLFISFPLSLPLFRSFSLLP